MDARAFDTRRIVAGVDESGYAAEAADWAAQLAVELGAELVAVHALDLRSSAVLAPDTAYFDEQHRRAGADLLARTAARISGRHPGLTVVTELIDGEPVRALGELGADADLLVTGSRGHGGFTGAMLGSVSNSLAAHAPCPLTVVGRRPPRPARAELVLGVGHKQELPPVDFAFATAARLGLSVRAVRAFEPWLSYHGSADQGTRSFLHEMRDLLAPACEAYPEVTVAVEHSLRVAVPALVEAGTGARLIVVGSHRRRGAPAFGPGHVVHGLLAHARTPVAVVPIP